MYVLSNSACGWPGRRILADRGADIIRIEPPQGDPARTFLGEHTGEVFDELTTRG